MNRLNINNVIKYNPTKILEGMANFYENLYSSKNDTSELEANSREFLSDNNIKKLNEQQKASCEGNITGSEILNAIKNMRKDKSPGIDGLPVEFYKHFWDSLGHFLTRSIREAFTAGALLATQKRGIITCIPKGDKPREFLKNWRPISLLNSDYKIITSVMANRMKLVLQDVIGTNQKGFLKGRYMEENTRLIRLN